MTDRKPKGLVLCGGNSRRMGRDKGLLSTEGKLWVEERIRTLSPFTDRCLISIRKEQKSDYTKAISDIEFVEDRFENIGPISGILSAHDRYPNDDFLVLACDMPSSDPWIFSELLKMYGAYSEAKSYFCVTEGNIEPFPAIYTSELLNEVAPKMNEPGFDSSPKNTLERSNGMAFEVGKDRSNIFLNYNTLADLSEAGASK